MNISEFKEFWKENDYRPVKRLGQNFLIDNNVRDKIIDAVGVTEDDTVLEIGPGFCAMTFEIAKRCRKIIAVEKDKKICGMMQPFFDEVPNADLVCGDFLEVDIASLAQGEKIKVFGNIPYYITTPVIEKIITEREHILDAAIVVQNELADRIISPPGSKVYGSISCFVQFYTRPKKVFKIKKNSFHPKPQVDSCLLTFAIPGKPTVEVADEDLMFRIIRKSFSERRKKVLNSLSDKDFLGIDREAWKEILTSSGIDPSSRAETLSLTDFAAISDRSG